MTNSMPPITPIRPITPSLAESFQTLDPFISRQQLRCIRFGLRGEEREYFIELTHRLAKTIQEMPATYEGRGDQAIIHLHYFRGSMDWWITEKDAETLEQPGQHQAFGLAKMQFTELGYISIVELVANNVELDFHWKPITLEELKRTLC